MTLVPVQAQVQEPKTQFTAHIIVAVVSEAAAKAIVVMFAALITLSMPHGIAAMQTPEGCPGGGWHYSRQPTSRICRTGLSSVKSVVMRSNSRQRSPIPPTRSLVFGRGVGSSRSSGSIADLDWKVADHRHQHPRLFRIRGRHPCRTVVQPTTCHRTWVDA